MAVAHILGFPRFGAKREIKKALESYWKKEISLEALLETGKKMRQSNWQYQADSGLDFVTVGDFSFYDHVLDMSAMLGVVPSRFGECKGQVDLDTVFRMARGRAPTGEDTTACEMTKWGDTNYHYIVPEFYSDQTFQLSSNKLFDEVEEAKAAGFRPKAVILGPLSYLWYGKTKVDNFDKLDLLDKLLPVYGEILAKLKSQGIEWVQVDEPILSLELSQPWRDQFEKTYHYLSAAKIKILLTTYFEGITQNLSAINQIPVEGFHIDLVRAPKQLIPILDKLSAYQILSCGVIDGRNIWKADLNKILTSLESAKERLGERLWIAPSCSLLHVPVDLAYEKKIDQEILNWLSFAKQKIKEVAILAQALNKGPESVKEVLESNQKAIESRRISKKIHHDAIKARMATIKDSMFKRSCDYKERRKEQMKALELPMFPTTSIGSFPQTQEIRRVRRQLKNGDMTLDAYRDFMQTEIKMIVNKQEKIGLDVLVHGEPERNDMVEYFGELLDGFAFTENGWVQSYGSRCVKPPIIYGDVIRHQPMTVDWSQYAQSLTKSHMKGMLTGPVTILCWSFVRDDQSRQDTANQIALALRDEVCDLEKAGIQIIQIDEPAFREGLPLLKSDQAAYLKWAVEAFRLAVCGVKNKTQIHTHMCYSEFNELIQSIAEMDADVITIETSRSDMELLKAFEDFDYPNEIGPGVYDIHSPRVPDVQEMVNLLTKAAEKISPDRLWVNPDCGLKTRDWKETEQALKHMVEAAKIMRESYQR